jgi:hypothetical protein
MAATALDMIPAIGARVLVRFETLQIECTVVNVKNSWGQPRLLIQPVAGNGEQWVELGRVTVPATEPLQNRPDREGLNRPALTEVKGEDWRDVRAARDFARD